MDVDNLIAIDTHTHLEVSCWNPFDSYGEESGFRSGVRPLLGLTGSQEGTTP